MNWHFIHRNTPSPLMLQQISPTRWETWPKTDFTLPFLLMTSLPYEEEFMFCLIAGKLGFKYTMKKVRQNRFRKFSHFWAFTTRKQLHSRITHFQTAVGGW